MPKKNICKNAKKKYGEKTGKNGEKSTNTNKEC